MKLCWDNLEGFRLTAKGNLKKYKGVIWDIKICEYCGKEFLAQRYKNQRYCDNNCRAKTCIGKNNPFYGKHHTEETKRNLSKISKAREGFWKDKYGKDSSNWKGGYRAKNIPRYDVYAPQLDWCEDVRRSPTDRNVLEVKCTYCGKWYIPKLYTVRHRIEALEGKARGEFRLYCSKQCKQACPIYSKQAITLMREDALRAGRLQWLELNREVQPELRQMVLKRDDYTCQKCSTADKPLHCHHIFPVTTDPLVSADIDNCITLCEDCHKEIHKQDGCRTGQLRIKVC